MFCGITLFWQHLVELAGNLFSTGGFAVRDVYANFHQRLSRPMKASSILIPHVRRCRSSLLPSLFPLPSALSLSLRTRSFPLSSSSGS